MNTVKNKLNFLQGGGEMGELMRNFDWEKTSLGDPSAWPLSLRTTVGIVLHSAFPMFLFWGKELLCFYNDAYRPSLGIDGKHPLIGKKAKDGWPDIWEFIGPLIEQVMTTGEPAWFEDQLLPIYRNGQMEDVYWTFSYSAAYGDDGQIEGVFVTCTETTSKVIALKNLEAEKTKFKSLIEEAPLATCLFTGKEMRVEIANDIVLKHWGKDKSVIGKPIVEALPEIKDQAFPKLLAEVYTTGNTYEAKAAKAELVLDGVPGTYYFDFTYKAVRNDLGEIYGVMSMSVDVTQQVLALQKLKRTQEELLVYFEQTPVAIATISKENLTFRLVNTFYAELVGRKPGEIDNKPLLEALPELAGQGFDTLLNEVIATGVPFIAGEVAVELKRNDKLETIYVNLTYQPQRDHNNTITGILVVATDVTQQVIARKTVEDTEVKLRSLVEEATVATGLLIGRELKIDIVNDLMIGVWGKGRSIIGKPLAEALPELKGQPFLQLLDDVFTTGITAEGKAVPATLEVDGVLGTYYFDYSYKAMRNAQGEIYGVVDMAIDVTQQVLTQRALAESKERLEFAIEATELGTWDLNPFTNKFRGNHRLKDWFGLTPEEEIELPLALSVIVPEDRERVTGAIGEALKYESGGKYDIEYTIQNPKSGKQLIVKAKGKANFNEQQEPILLSGTLQDVTAEATIRKQLAIEVLEQLKAKNKLEESELFSRDVIYNSPVAKIVYTGEDMIVSIANENMLQLIGRDNSIVGKRFDEAIPELAGSIIEERMRNVLLTGETYSQAEDKIDLVRFGKPYSGYYNYIYKALRNVSGTIYGIMATATEVTEQVVARKLIEAKEKELRDLIKAAPIGICVLTGPDAKVEEVNDRFMLIAGKKPQQFVDAYYWDIFPEVAEKFASVLEKVFKTGVKFSTEEEEMVLIRFGVPEKIYTSFDYVPVIDTQNIVVKVIVLVIEITQQVETRKQIEEAVVNRTKELAQSNLNLKRSNAELEQFAYIASHDLQEPIRKISTFTQLLERSVPDLSQQSKNYIDKIYGSTDRMTKLIRDVLAFSQITQNTDVFEETDLSKLIKSIETDFELTIEQTGAVIKVTDLPVINAIPSQMTQLFSNLLSNSLKYTRKGVKPLIEITSVPATKKIIAEHPQLSPNKAYHHITFSDNGIGFDREHADRIFKIFQRLHGKNEFEGTGIGLSVCRKIVQSHHGHISASVRANGGAEFHVLLPVD